MRNVRGFGTPAQTNQRFRYLLEQGQTGLSTAFDFPTLMGYDSDSPRALGEVGMCGVAVDRWPTWIACFKRSARPRDQLR